MAVQLAERNLANSPKRKWPTRRIEPLTKGRPHSKRHTTEGVPFVVPARSPGEIRLSYARFSVRKHYVAGVGMIAVTHVLVNDPTRGYGIFIDTMLDAAA